MSVPRPSCWSNGSQITDNETTSTFSVYLDCKVLKLMSVIGAV